MTMNLRGYDIDDEEPMALRPLRPCPFCGKTENESVDYDGFVIRCAFCRAKGPQHLGDEYDEAAQAWNERPEENRLSDLPICRLQLPDGSVPTGTEAALTAWHRVAVDALAALTRERALTACPRCEGKGTVGKIHGTDFGALGVHQVPCAVCDGKGTL